MAFLLAYVIDATNRATQMTEEAAAVAKQAAAKALSIVPTPLNFLFSFVEPLSMTLRPMAVIH